MVVATAAILVLLASGCDAQSAGPRTAETSQESTASAPSTTVPATAVASAPPGALQAIDIAALPVGPPPEVDYLAGGAFGHAGRTVETDFPTDAVYVEILGTVDGRVVVRGAQGPKHGDRFWAIDPAGHAERVGGTYQHYDYSARLVEETGHIWVQYGDLSTKRTIWAVDARTGREIAAYPDNQEPHGLAPADQALVDAWVDRRTAVPGTEAHTRDRSLVAEAWGINSAAGEFGLAVVVRRQPDGLEVARFTFDANNGAGVSRVVFEDRRHVLVLATVSFTKRRGHQQAIVRCSLADGSCERATDSGGNMALGVSRPLFEPSRSHR